MKLSNFIRIYTNTSFYYHLVFDNYTIYCIKHLNPVNDNIIYIINSK